MEKSPVPSNAQFGTTMRIELAPALLEQSRRREEKAIPRMPASLPGGIEFQQLLHNIYDAVLITDMAGEVAMANVRANQFFVAEPGQLSSYNMLTLVCGAAPALLDTIQQTLESNRFVLLQAHCLRMDGSVFPAEISVNRLRLGGKQYLSFFVRDITLRKEQEESLRTGHTALKNASSAIVIAGLQAEIEYFNPAFLSLVGLDGAGELGERRLTDFLCDTALVGQLLGVIRSGTTWSGELEIRRADGGLLFAHASVAANVNSDGETTGMVVSLLDITAQRRAQQQLEAYAAELNRRNLQMEEDLKIASELHQALLPADFVLFPRGALEPSLRFSHLYRPSGSIGGDFFDLRRISEHEAGLFIADVMGHGIRSALVVATLRGLLEEVRATQNDPGQLLTQLNATYSAIFKRLGGDVIFATAFYAVIDTRTGLLRYANASHPLPYLLRRRQASIERPQPVGASGALGLFERTVFSTGSLEMAVGDLLLLYTDGLSETENASCDSYESLRLGQQLQACLKLPAAELLEFLTEDARRFSQSGDFADDVCLLAMERLK